MILPCPTPYHHLLTSLFIEIQKVNLPATYDYYSYPKMDKDVFLMCHFTSIAEQNFLAGRSSNLF